MFRVVILLTCFIDRKGDFTARQESQSELFHDFLFRTDRYERLSLFENDDVEKNSLNSLILVEVSLNKHFLYVGFYYERHKSIVVNIGIKRND